MSISGVSSAPSSAFTVVRGAAVGSLSPAAALQAQQQDVLKKIAAEQACQTDDAKTKADKITAYKAKLAKIAAQITKAQQADTQQSKLTQVDKVTRDTVTRQQQASTRLLDVFA